jgi:RNA polymerase sigma-70 factor (ECF subfamily)
MATQRSHVPLSLVVGLDRRTVSDGDLARGLIAGDSWAITEAWRRLAPMVLMLAKRSLGSASEAEDIAQEVFHRLYRKAHQLREPDSLRSFIYGCTLHALQSELRRRKLRGWLSLEKPETLASVRDESVDLEQQDLLRRFKGLLDRLSPRDRMVFTLRRMESMTVEEIASAMKISQSTVKRSITYASDRLTRWIQADPGMADLLNQERSEL